jgi:hypothetical protein
VVDQVGVADPAVLLEHRQYGAVHVIRVTPPGTDSFFDCPVASGLQVEAFLVQLPFRQPGVDEGLSCGGRHGGWGHTGRRRAPVDLVRTGGRARV